MTHNKYMFSTSSIVEIADQHNITTYLLAQHSYNLPNKYKILHFFLNIIFTFIKR